MTMSNINALELLGKVVSFEYVRELSLSEQSSITFREKVCGKVDSIVLSIATLPEISVDGGDFYSLEHLFDFLVIPDNS